MLHKFRSTKILIQTKPRRTFALRKSSPTTIEVCVSALSSLDVQSQRMMAQICTLSTRMGLNI